MLEILHLLSNERNHKQTDSIHQQIFDIYCNLPQDPKAFKDGPTWVQIKEEDLVDLPEMDKHFLFTSDNGSNGYHNYFLSAHTRENESWLGISFREKRIRYCMEGLDLRIHYEKKEGDEWSLVYNCEVEDLETITPLITLGKRYCELGSRSSTS